MLVNAADDPLVHESLLTIPKSLSGESLSAVFPATQQITAVRLVPFAVLSADGDKPRERGSPWTDSPGLQRPLDRTF